VHIVEQYRVVVAAKLIVYLALKDDVVPYIAVQQYLPENLCCALKPSAPAITLKILVAERKIVAFFIDYLAFY
jgi:hypothetical protein